MESTSQVDSPPEGSKIQRACDSCRVRKIKCDRAHPCSNCVASKLACHTTVASQKPARQRIHVSDEYEKKINRIEERLARIENLLSALVSRPDPIDIPDNTIRVQAPTPSNHSSPALHPAQESGPATPFDAGTTLDSHSEFARNVLEQAVVNTPSIEDNTELRAALSGLQSIVSRLKVPSRIDCRPLPLRNLTTTDRPPWEAVGRVLAWASEQPTMSVSIVYPFLQLRDFKDIYIEAFHSNEVSPPRLILVYATLYHLFSEYCLRNELDGNRRIYRHHYDQCRNLLDSAIGRLDLFLTPSYENCLALFLASAYAIEICRPSMSWVLTSAAACMCQTLGYHRSTSLKDDNEAEENGKVYLFWAIYIMDKSLSLRLGRASAIQDWDTSVPEPSHETWPIHSCPAYPGSDIQLYWIKIARLQGLTYEKLFSPAAFGKSDTERRQIASELEQSLNESLEYRNRTAPEFSRVFGSLGDLFLYADTVMHYSILTLIQRAVSLNSAIESARRALQYHQECSNKFNIQGNEEIWTGYLHWTIMQAPFTPFIVIFCNAILSANQTDLQILTNFVTTLEPCRALSDGADKLYRLCHMFQQVAKLYVEVKNKPRHGLPSFNQAQYPEGQFVLSAGPADIDMPPLDQLDPYLSALGLMPSTWADNSGTEPNATASAVPIEGFDDPSTLQAWYSGSRYIMGLMEDDMTMFQ